MPLRVGHRLLERAAAEGVAQLAGAHDLVFGRDLEAQAVHLVRPVTELERLVRSFFEFWLYVF